MIFFNSFLMITVPDKLYSACVLVDCWICSDIVPTYYDSYEAKINQRWRIISGNITPFQKLFEGSKVFKNVDGILMIENRDYIGPLEGDEDELKDAKLDPSNYSDPKFIQAKMTIRFSRRTKLGRKQIAITFNGETKYLNPGDKVSFGTIDNPKLCIMKANN